MAWLRGYLIRGDYYVRFLLDDRRNGALFPHHYDLLKRDYIKKVETIERLEGTHLFPSYIP